MKEIIEKMRKVMKIIGRSTRREPCSVLGDLLVSSILSFILILTIIGMAKDTFNYTLSLRQAIAIGAMVSLMFYSFLSLTWEEIRQEGIKELLAEGMTLQSMVEKGYISKEEMEELKEKYGGEK